MKQNIVYVNHIHVSGSVFPLVLWLKKNLTCSTCTANICDAIQSGRSSLFLKVKSGSKRQTTWCHVRPSRLYYSSLLQEPQISWNSKLFIDTVMILCKKMNYFNVTWFFSNFKVIFSILQVEFLQHTLRFEVMEANMFARQIVVSHGFDVLDIHHHLRMQIHRYFFFPMLNTLRTGNLNY
jgi:hypothetical protein